MEGLLFKMTKYDNTKLAKTYANAILKCQEINFVQVKYNSTFSRLDVRALVDPAGACVLCVCVYLPLASICPNCVVRISRKQRPSAVLLWQPLR